MRSAGNLMPNAKGLNLAPGHTCPVCKGMFWPTKSWGCGYGETLVCSIPCMKQLEREALERDIAKRKKTKAWKAYTMARDGYSYDEIAEAVNTNRCNVATMIFSVRDYPPKVLKALGVPELI